MILQPENDEDVNQLEHLKNDANRQTRTHTTAKEKEDEYAKPQQQQQPQPHQEQQQQQQQDEAHPHPPEEHQPHELTLEEELAAAAAAAMAFEKLRQHEDDEQRNIESAPTDPNEGKGQLEGELINAGTTSTASGHDKPTHPPPKVCLHALKATLVIVILFYSREFNIYYLIIRSIAPVPVAVYNAIELDYIHICMAFFLKYKRASYLYLTHTHIRMAERVENRQKEKEEEEAFQINITDAFLLFMI